MKKATCIVKNYAGDSMEIPMSETAFMSAVGRMRQGKPFKEAFRSLRVDDREKVFQHLMAPKAT